MLRISVPSESFSSNHFSATSWLANTLMGVFIADRLAGVDVDPSHFHRSILPGLRRIYVSLLSQCFPILARFEGQQTRANKSTGYIVGI